MTWRATRRRDSPFPSLLPFYASPNTLSSPLPIPVPPLPAVLYSNLRGPPVSGTHGTTPQEVYRARACAQLCVRVPGSGTHGTITPGSLHYHACFCVCPPPLQKIVCLRGPQVSGTHGTTPHEVRAPYLANSYLACVPFDQAVPSSFFVVHACSLVWCRPTCCLLLRVPPIAHRALGRNGCSFSLIRREGD